MLIRLIRLNKRYVTGLIEQIRLKYQSNTFCHVKLCNVSNGYLMRYNGRYSVSVRMLDCTKMTFESIHCTDHWGRYHAAIDVDVHVDVDVDWLMLMFVLIIVSAVIVSTILNKRYCNWSR